MSENPLGPAALDAKLDGRNPLPPLVEIIPFGRIDEVAAAIVAANLQEFLRLRTSISPSRSAPPNAHLPARNQYDAAVILKELQAGLNPLQVRLGLTNLDLTLPILTYVFGEALVGGRTAVVSLFRLGKAPGQTRMDLGRLYERLIKVALHETAHALGVSHCRRPGCLMRFSYGLEQLDAQEIRFCPECREELIHREKALSPTLEFT